MVAMTKQKLSILSQITQAYFTYSGSYVPSQILYLKHVTIQRKCIFAENHKSLFTTLTNTITVFSYTYTYVNKIKTEYYIEKYSLNNCINLMQNNNDLGCILYQSQKFNSEWIRTETSMQNLKPQNF